MVSSIDFTVLSNHIDGRHAEIMIYKISEDEVMENIVTMPIVQEIPIADDDKMYFPLYIKPSYKRADPDSPLEKCEYNIGLTVRGHRQK